MSEIVKTAEKAAKGKTLKQRLEENEKLFVETGCLFGLEELELKEKDPINYGILWNTFQNMLYTAYETARRISGSVTLTEQGECMWGLLTPTGDSIVTSGGIPCHLSPQSLTVKNIIRLNYEEDPGINEGDIFENNLTQFGTTHAGDIHDLLPIFWERELVGWAGGMNHAVEVGSMLPGSNCNMHPNMFGEGMHVCLEKVGSNYEFHRSYLMRVEHCVRTPSAWVLDCKARVGGSVIIRDKVLDLIKKYGVDYYKNVTQELIEDGRRNGVQRLKKQSVPGRLRKSTFFDMVMNGRGLIPQQQNNFIRSLPIETKLGLDGRMEISLDGATQVEPFGTNTTPENMKAGTLIPFVQLVGHEMPNSGTASLFDLEAPAGSCVNAFATNPFAGSLSGWSCVHPYGQTMFELISRSYFSRGFVEEVVSSAGNSGGSRIILEGIGMYGKHGVFDNMEMVAMPMPARAIADGDPCCWSSVHSMPDQTNAESYEAWYPALYLGRNIEPDSGGFGKYRGGLAFTSVFMIMNTPGLWGTNEAPPNSLSAGNYGVYGSIPTGPRGADWTHRANLKELAESRKPLIHSRRSGDLRSPEILKLQGDIHNEILGWCNDPEQFKEYDVIVCQRAGQPGMGDPIERDPALVKKDLDEGDTFLWTANNIFCVEASYDDKAEEWRIDYDKTEKRRQEMREKRKSRGQPFKEWWKTERKKVIAKEMREEIVAMLRSSMQLGPRTNKEIREFWRLPSDFNF